jgi:tetratricopeptide (TPR) repeat protein
VAAAKPARPQPRHAGSATTRNGRKPQRVRVGSVPPITADFAGRPDSARAIPDALAAGTSLVLVPGSGFAEGQRNWLGASGKTQLAVYLAESLWRSAAVDVLVWITATDRASILSGYVQASEAVTGIEPAGPAEAVAARFTGWLGGTSQQWLVVLDDLPDTADVDGLWPSGPAGRVVVTTARFPATSDREMRVFPVGLFSVREALDCLTGRLSENSAQRQGAIDLIETLGREPLALAQACAVITSSGMTCREYREYLVRRRQQMRVIPGQPASAASATWTLSFDHAEVLLPGDSIRLILVLVAVLDGHGIPGAVFSTAAVSAYLGEAGPQAASPAFNRTWDALLALERAGLLGIDRSDNPPVIRMSLAAQAAILAAAPPQWRDRAVRVAADALMEVWPANEPLAWTAIGLRANAASLWRTAPEALVAGGCHLLLLRAGHSLDDARLTGPAVDHWRQLAAYTDKVPGHPDSPVIAVRLAAAYLAAGQGAEAAVWYRRVLADRLRALAPGDPAVIGARIGLGRALVKASQFDEAIAVLSEAVNESEKYRVPGHVDTLGATEDLAVAYLAAGNAAEAVRLLRRTLGERERLAGPRDPATIATREQLSAALLADGKVKEALSYSKRVLADREHALGADHPDTIAARAAHAAVNHAAGRMPAALQLSEQACRDSITVLGADYPDTLARRANLAHLYYAAGRVGDATDVLRDTVTRCQRVLPAADPLTATVRQSLTNITGE